MRIINKLIKFISILIILIIALPILIIIFIIIFIGNGMPIIHKREVLGLGGKIFQFYKFRTMVKNADEILDKWQQKNSDIYKLYEKNTKLISDPRVTSFGRILRKTSLDELPQLINVLKGEMNLVGPRPITIRETKHIDKEKLEIRNSIRPGITGLWQVNGRQNTTFQERIVLDIEYINNRSLLLDLKIILRTLPIIIRGKGAF